MVLSRILGACSLGVLVAACGARTELLVDEGRQDTCRELTAAAEHATLDVFVLMDISASMSQLTADGTMKWDAVRDALAAFLTQPGSEGIGAGITFFPIVDTSVPDVCTSDAECGDGSCTPLGLCDGAQVGP